MIERRPGERAYVHCPGTDADDHDLLPQIGKEYVTKVGIDAPFGWPSEFIEAINAYHAAGTWEPLSGDRLRLRETDRAVRDETGITPLSVSTDKIAIVAMRCAKLLAADWPGGSPARSGRYRETCRGLSGGGSTTMASQPQGRSGGSRLLQGLRTAT